MCLNQFESSRKLFTSIVISLAICLALVPSTHAAAPLSRSEWKVAGVTREALLHIPNTAKTRPTPVVFVFHGHGGTMRKAATMFRINQIWPDAIVVYPQGLNAPGRIVDPEGKKSGWQSVAGELGDRDLKFFDAIYKSLNDNYKVDIARVYATGHSNGAAFTYLLWSARREKFAAFAPSAGVLPALLDENPRADFRINKRKLAAFNGNAKPVLHIAGSNDPLVKYDWQKNMIDGVRSVNQCLPGKPWRQDKRCTIFESKLGAPVITHIHAEKHGLPPYVPGLIVTFFKLQRGK